jgi:hypothetical protein
VEDLVGLRGNLNLKWEVGDFFLFINWWCAGFYAKKFKTKMARNKINNKVRKDTEYRTIITMRGWGIMMENSEINHSIW